MTDPKELMPCRMTELEKYLERSKGWYLSLPPATKHMVCQAFLDGLQWHPDLPLNTRASQPREVEDTIPVPRATLQGVREAKIEWQISSSTGNPDLQYEKAKALLKALATLDAVLSEGK